MITPKDIENLLNEFVRIDRDAIEALIEQRVACTKAVEEHPTLVPSGAPDGQLAIGPLGLVNGIVGLGGELIEAVYDTAKVPRLMHFRLRKKT